MQGKGRDRRSGAGQVQPLTSSVILCVSAAAGTGKTMIGKAIAAEAGARFFSISASTITSKWVRHQLQSSAQGLKRFIPSLLLTTSSTGAASSLAQHGESEKLVRTLFGVARCYSPAIVFVDEIDSVLSPRHGGEFDATRRIKTELLIEMDGVIGEKETERLLVLGATNLPHDIDTAAVRRMTKSQPHTLRGLHPVRTRVVVGG